MLPRGKVLLVDDEPGSLETLRDVLEGEGYQVALATSGYEAREKVKREGFSLALLDYCMPGLNGIQTLAEIRRVRPGQPAAFMTAYVVPELATLGSRGSCLGTFTKPLNIASLRKPIDMHYFLESLERALEKQHLARVLRQRLREVEAAARLNAQVLTERVHLMEQLERTQTHLAILHQALLKASQATDARELTADLLSLIECSDYSCLALTNSCDGNGNLVGRRSTSRRTSTILTLIGRKRPPTLSRTNPNLSKSPSDNHCLQRRSARSKHLFTRSKAGGSRFTAKPKPSRRTHSNSSRALIRPTSSKCPRPRDTWITPRSSTSDTEMRCQVEGGQTRRQTGHRALTNSPT